MTDRLQQCDCGWSGLQHYRVGRRFPAFEAHVEKMRRKGKDIFGRKVKQAR
jgi:hypothetical protein